MGIFTSFLPAILTPWTLCKFASGLIVLSHSYDITNTASNHTDGLIISKHPKNQMALCSRKWCHVCGSVCACMPVFLYKLACLTNCLAMLMKIGIANSFPYAPQLGGCGAKLRADISQGLKRNTMRLDGAGRHLGGALSCGGWMASLWDALGSHFGRLWSKQLTVCSVTVHNIIQCDLILYSIILWDVWTCDSQAPKQKETQVEAKVERKFNVFPIKLQPLLFCVNLILFFHFTLSLKSPTIYSSLKEP